MVKIEIIKPLKNKPAGWDISDAIKKDQWSKRHVMGFIKSSKKIDTKKMNIMAWFDQQSGKPKMNHAFLAEYLKCQYGEDIRFNHTCRQWFIWNGKYWKADNKGRINLLAIKSARHLYAEAIKWGKKDANALEIAKYANRAQDEYHLRATIKLAESIDEIAMTQDEFDKKQNLFNLKNGTYNLITHELQPHLRDDFITKIMSYEYSPDAGASFWIRSVRFMFKRNNETIRYLQQLIGYSLAGNANEQIMVLLYGTGKNGKSTMISAWEFLLGDYARKGPQDMLMKQNVSRIPNDIAKIAGARLVVCEEISRGYRLDEAKVKNLTGGDIINARFLHQEFFEFRPTHLLVMVGNYKPKITDKDNGIWRRVKVLEFKVQIPSSIQISSTKIREKLKEELPGIFNWAIIGLKDYQKNGLIESKDVKAASAMYREESDEIAQFVNDNIIQETGIKIEAKELYAEYLAHCKEIGCHPTGKNGFNTELRNRGFRSIKGNANKLVWVGIGCKK